MKIAIASDHHGVSKRKKIIKYLVKKGYEVEDYGSFGASLVNFNEYAVKVSESVAKNEADLGILFCGTGIGMSIAANKVKGIRAAKLNTLADAKFAKLHNNANVITFSENESTFKIKDMIDLFIKTKFSEVERYTLRNNAIRRYEDER